MNAQRTAIGRQTTEQRPVTDSERPKRPSAGAGIAPALPGPGRPTARTASAERFLSDLRSMCSLIDEADRYGATSSMETRFMELRKRITLGFRSLPQAVIDASGASNGFHGCGFEMILGSTSLDSLVRGPGRRAIDRLTIVWQAVQAESLA